MKKIILSIIAIVIITLIGVGGYSEYKEKQSNKYVELGVNRINNCKYNDAINYMNKALKFNKNNLEAENIIKIINGYEDSEKDFKEENFKQAQQLINNIPKEYIKYSIKNSIDKLKNNINEKLVDIEKVNNEINEVKGDIKDNNFKKAKTDIDKINIENGDKDQIQQINKYNSEIDTQLAAEQKLEVQKKIQSKNIQLKQKESEAKNKSLDKNIPTDKSRSIDQNKSVDKNNDNISNNNIVQKIAINPNVYIANDLGLSITFPASWSGKYYIKSRGKDGLVVMMKSNNKTKYPNEGELFEIDSASTYGLLDGPRIIKSKNGITYYAGPQTGMTIDENNPQFEEWKEMSQSTYNVIDTIKCI